MFAVPQQNAVNTNPDFIDLSNPSTNHGLNDGLVLHVRFLPRLFNTDLYPDLSPQQNDLTLANVASSDLLADFENGRWGYLDCDGTSGQYGYCPLSDSLELTQLTFAGWVYITDIGIRAIIEKREQTTSAWCIYSSSRLILVAGSDRNNAVVVTSQLDNATWCHVTVTLDNSGNAKGYINGVLSLSDTTDAPGSQPTFPVILGARWDNIGTGAVIREFSGRLDGIRLYNRVLSASEIADLYQQELAFNPDTIARFNPISLLSYSQDVGPFASVSSVGLVNQNPDFIDLSNPINWDHPLARHLKHLWLATPQYNGGLTFIDLCDPASYGTLTNMDGSNWVQLSENGQFAGLQFDGATEYVDFSGISGLPTVDTESFTSIHIFRKTDSSTGGSKIINNATVGGLGWTDAAGRGFEAGVPALGGSSTTVANIEISGTPHTTFDNLWHFVGFNSPGGNLLATPSLVKWVVDGVQYDGAAGNAVGNISYRIGGRGSTAGFPGIIACHALWIPAIGPELLAEFEVEAEAGYPNLLNRIPALPFTYSLNLTPPVVIPWQGNVANQNPDFIDLSNPIASHGLNDGLVGWWKSIPNVRSWDGFVFHDIGPNQLHGTRTARYDSTLDTHDGGWGKVNFNSGGHTANDYFVVDDPHDLTKIPNTDPFSCFLWYYSGGDNNDQRAVAWDDGSSDAWYIFVKDNGSADRLQIPGLVWQTSAGASFVTGRWYHVGFTFDGTTGKLFYNGVEKASGAVSFSYSGFGNQTLNIGGENDKTAIDTGAALDDVMLWHRCLTPTEVAELYNESKSYYPNLLNRIPSLLPVSVSEAAGGAYSLTVDSQSITVTGTDASLLYDRILSVDSGSFTLTGTAANLNKGFTLVVDSQAITVTGTAVEVLFNRSLSVDSQAITVTGTVTSLNKGFTLQGDSQNLTVSGTAASTLYNRSVSVESQTITVTGTAANTIFSRSLSADTQAITVTGTAVSTLFNRALSADSGTVTVAGQIVTLTLSGVGSYSLDADGAVMTVTGTAASLLLDRVLNAETDSLNVTGTAASVLYGRSLSASGGTLTITGTDASTLFNRSISAGFGTLTVAGTAANFTYSGDLGVYINEIEVELDVEDTVIPSLTVTESVLVSVE